jgi:hypothetical protein
MSRLDYHRRGRTAEELQSRLVVKRVEHMHLDVRMPSAILKQKVKSREVAEKERKRRYRQARRDGLSEQQASARAKRPERGGPTFD